MCKSTKHEVGSVLKQHGRRRIGACSGGSSVTSGATQRRARRWRAPRVGVSNKGHLQIRSLQMHACRASDAALTSPCTPWRALNSPPGPSTTVPSLRPPVAHSECPSPTARRRTPGRPPAPPSPPIPNPCPCVCGRVACVPSARGFPDAAQRDVTPGMGGSARWQPPSHPGEGGAGGGARSVSFSQMPSGF